MDGKFGEHGWISWNLIGFYRDSMGVQCEDCEDFSWDLPSGSQPWRAGRLDPPSPSNPQIYPKSPQFYWKLSGWLGIWSAGMMNQWICCESKGTLFHANLGEQHFGPSQSSLWQTPACCKAKTKWGGWRVRIPCDLGAGHPTCNFLWMNE